MGICCSSGPPPVFLNLVDSKAVEDTKVVYEKVADLISRAEQNKKILSTYKDCKVACGTAMKRNVSAEETKALEIEALKLLLPCVEGMAILLQWKNELLVVFFELLDVFSQEDAWENQHACAKQLVELFGIILDFDTVRMFNSNMLNDLAFYNRFAPKHIDNPDVKLPLTEEEAQDMRTSLAQYNTLQALGDKLTATNNDLDIRISYSNSLGILANALSHQIKQTTDKAGLGLQCARGLTGTIVLYDQISTFGVFHKSSQIQLKRCVHLLKKTYPKEPTLLTPIQFSTKNFKYSSSSMQELFD